MKNSILALILLLSSISAAGQTMSHAFKNANIIIVQTPDSTRKAIRQIAQQLQAQGFLLDAVNYDLGSIQTKPTPLTGKRGGYAEATVLCVASGNAPTTLRLSGNISGTISGTHITLPAMVKGDEEDSRWKAFRMMEMAARAYPGAVLSFEAR